MKVLIVAAYNTGHFAPFVIEQGESLQRIGVEIAYFGVVGRGILGYLRNRKKLIAEIKRFQPDLVHAHYGISGLLANLQRRVPVITTYHGCDVQALGKNLLLSRITMKLSLYNIFVSQRLYNISKYKKDNYSIIACGTDTSIFYPIDRKEARTALNWDNQMHYILFSGAFDNSVKKAPLAQAAVQLIDNSVLVELKGYSRQQIALLLNACDVQLTTSLRESGPLIVKEAMACNCSVVSVDVGDVKEITQRLEGYYLAEKTPEDLAKKLQLAIAYQDKTNGRQRLIDLKLDLESVASEIKSIYHRLLKGY